MWDIILINWNCKHCGKTLISQVLKLVLSGQKDHVEKKNNQTLKLEVKSITKQPKYNLRYDMNPPSNYLKSNEQN